MAKLDFSAFFDFGDDQEIKKAIEVLNTLDSMYGDMSTSIQEQNNKISQSMRPYVAELDRLEKAMRALDSTNQNSLKQAEQYSKQVEQEAASLITLRKAHEQNLNIQKQVTANQQQAVKAAKNLTDVQKQEQLIATKLRQARENESNSLKALKLELDAARKSYELMGDSTDAATKDNARLNVERLAEAFNKGNVVLKEAIRAQEMEAGSLNQLKAKLKETEAAFRQMGDATDEAFKGAALESITDLTVKVNKADQAIKDAKKGVTATAGSYVELDREVKDLLVDLRNMPNAFNRQTGAINKNNREARELAKTIEVKTKALKDFDKAVNENFRNVGNYSSALEGLNKGFAGFLSEGGLGELSSGNLAGLGQMFSGISGALPQLAIATGVIAGLGVGFNELAKLGKEVEEQFRTVTSVVDLQGEALAEYTAKLRASSTVFEQDFNETLRTSNVLMEVFGVTGTESIDLINEAFLRGANLSGDVTDQIREYATQLETAGMSGQDMVDLMVLAQDKGIWNDKAVDTIKEGGLRIREMTKATTDALAPLGKLVNEQIRQEVAQGNTVRAMQIVAREMESGKLTAQQYQTIIADVFAAPGEDAGKQMFEILREIELGTDDAGLSLSEYQKVQLESLKVQEDYQRSLVSLGRNFMGIKTNLDNFVTSMKGELIKALDDVVIAFTSAEERMGSFKDQLAKIESVEAAAAEVKILEKALKDVKKEADESDTAVMRFFRSVTPDTLLGMASSRFQERVKEVEEQLALARKRQEELSKQSTEKQAQENAKVELKAAQDIAKRVAAANRNLQRIKLESSIATNKLIVKDDEYTMIERMQAARDIAEAEIVLSRLTRDEKLANENLIAEERAVFVAQHKAEIKEIEREMRDTLDKIGEDVIKLTKKTGTAKLFPEIVAPKIDPVDMQQTSMTKAFAKLEEARAKDLINAEEYGKAILQLQEGNLKGYIAALRAAGANEREIKQAELEYWRFVNEQKDASTQQMIEKLAEFTSSALTSIQDIATGFSDRRIQAMEAELARAEAIYDKEMELAGTSGRAKERAEEKFTKKQEEINARIAEQKRKQAVADKAFAISQIAINTAVAISRTMAEVPKVDFGISTAVLIGAYTVLGAAQAAAVLAAPIPEFYTGTDYAPEGWAWVGERGRELVVTPAGELAYTPAKPTLAYLEEGTKVVDNKTTERLAKKALNEQRERDILEADYNVEEASYFRGMNGLKTQALQEVANIINVQQTNQQDPRLYGAIKDLHNAIINKKEFNLNITRDGVQFLVQEGNTWTEIVNERYKG